ncbi:MAG: hypothetical protein Q8M31_04240 [Beijerinckiaceae bacterium]|nr:hypothetical protein [Beijerinckiaceae bacterium]
MLNWVIAGLSAAAAVWVGWMLDWPWIFDMHDPEFNPMIMFEGLLIGVAAWHIVKALRWRARSRAFGVTNIKISGRTPAPLGGELSGVLHLGRPVAPTADWTLKLTCLDIHETHDTRDAPPSPYRRDAYPVWSTTITLPAGIDTARGLPFRFQLPDSVGPKPVQPMERKSAHFRFTASLNIPGFRRIVTHNAPPVARSWRLLVTAPTSGPNFRVEFVVPVED